MIDDQKLYELLKDFDPAVGERMENISRTGRFTLTLAAAAIPSLRGIPSTRSFPTLRKKGSEGIVKKLKRLMEKDLWEKESET